MIKIILVDFHQTMIANIMRLMYSDSTSELSEDLLRHNILNSLLRYRKKFKREYGEILISCDSKHSWRKDIFPHYKAKRKKWKEESNIDWDFIHKFMDKMKAEIKTDLPFITVEVPKAESDDVIAVLDQYILSEAFANKNVIISRDKDFKQLLSERTIQFNPIDNVLSEKPWFDGNPTNKELLVHIMKGDVADGIPNMLSDDDTFVVEGKRQKPLSQKKIEWYLEEAWNNMTIFDNTHFKRNQRLIDFHFIPEDVRGSIIDEYEAQKEAKSTYSSNDLINYFMENRLNNMMENIQEFFI